MFLFLAGTDPELREKCKSLFFLGGGTRGQKIVSQAADVAVVKLWSDPAVAAFKPRTGKERNQRNFKVTRRLSAL